MPQFTQWNVPDPFPNILFNPMAVDAAIAKTRSELGGLDIERQKLGLEQAKFDRGVTEGEGYIGGALSGTAEAPGAGAVPGGGGSFLGALARIESGDKNIVSGTDKDNQGLTLAQGGNPAEISQGHFQIHTGTWKDFAPQAGVDVNQYPNAMSAPREIQARVASVIPFSRFGPRTQALMRQQFGDIDSNQTVGVLAGLGPRAGSAAVAGPGASAPPPATRRVADAPPPPPIPLGNPNAGPRVGLTPPPVTATAPSVAPPAVDPNTAAVKQASAALLNMPEPDAAAAYPAVVRELQARGFAMNAPPEYPGHAALQALVGGGDVAATAVEPSRVAMRTGGTDAAGPGAGQAAPPPVEQPNRLYPTGLPGVTINTPGNPLAPPAPTAAAPAAAPPGAARPPPEAPPAAPSRVIQREPLLSNNLTASQQDAARRAIRAGTPLATVQAHVEQWKQENVAARHQDAVDAAVQQQQDYERRKAAEETQYTRGRNAESDARAEEAARIAREKADREAKAAEDPVRGEHDKRMERTLLTIGPKVARGIPLTPDEQRQYSLHWNEYRAGPIQDVQDSKGGTFKARVPREVPPEFPPPPGQTVAPGPQPIPGTEKPPDFAPQAVVGGLLANAAGQDKIVKALTSLNAYPGAIGAMALQPDFLAQRTDPAGVPVRAAIADVAGHIFHDMAGSAQTPAEAARLKPYAPQPTDTAQALKDKMNRLLELNRETMLRAYRVYGPEGGGRKNPVVEEAILGSIPEAAMDMLKAKPETARDFDKMYGRGISKLVLQDGR